MDDSTGKAAAAGDGTDEKQDAPKVARILSVQQTEGMGKTYLCVLEGSGKKVQVRSTRPEQLVGRTMPLASLAREGISGGSQCALFCASYGHAESDRQS